MAIDVDGGDKRGTRKCGYSTIAMLVAVVLGLLMMAVMIVVGYTSYKPGIPLSGSSSMAISAACHPEKEDPGDDPMSEQKLQWGVETYENGIGHCAFSSREVGPLVKGHLYL